MTSKPDGYLYVLEAKDQELFKIGKTQKPKARFKQLRVGTQCFLQHVFEVADYSEREKDLHCMFADKRLPQSEWFGIGPGELDEITRWLESFGATDKTLEYLHPLSHAEPIRKLLTIPDAGEFNLAIYSDDSNSDGDYVKHSVLLSSRIGDHHFRLTFNQFNLVGQWDEQRPGLEMWTDNYTHDNDTEEMRCIDDYLAEASECDRWQNVINSPELFYVHGLAVLDQLPMGLVSKAIQSNVGLIADKVFRLLGARQAAAFFEAKGFRTEAAMADFMETLDGFSARPTEVACHSPALVMTDYWLRGM